MTKVSEDVTNYVEIVGTLANDFEVKNKNGYEFCNLFFKIKKSDKNPKKPQIPAKYIYISVHVCGTLLDTVKSLKEGASLRVIGELDQYRYQDTEGKWNSKISVKSTKIEKLSQTI